MDHLMDLRVDHLMVKIMEPLIDLLTDHVTEKTINLMDPGINPCTTLLMMDFQHLILTILQITMFPCSPLWVKWEEVIIPLAKAMVCITIKLI